jgi:hypothetical protein
MLRPTSQDLHLPTGVLCMFNKYGVAQIEGGRPLTVHKGRVAFGTAKQLAVGMAVRPMVSYNAVIISSSASGRGVFGLPQARLFQACELDAR